MARLLRPIAAAAALCLAAGAAAAQPKPDLWPRWTAHDPAATETIDHSAWQAFLDAFVIREPDGINRVAYAAVGEADLAALDAYLAALSATPISRYARPEQRAFWIDLYNTRTVRLILEHYPVARILDIRISPGWFSLGPWGKKLVTVEGVALSLDDIEHRILRPIWRDPRIHYALNCASLGCPNLRRTAFTGANAEALLDAAARAYVNHPRGAHIVDGRLYVSSIYKWFKEDFGGGDAGVIAHLRRYADPDLASRLASITRIGGYGYDWSLNDARPPE